MSRRSGRWWRSIAATASVLALVPALAGAAPVPAGQPDQAALDQALQAGGEAASRVMRKYGGKDALRQGAIEPMTTTAPLSTIDSSRQFQARLAFPSSNRFLDVMIQPGSTGDIASLIVAQDLDFDGQMDSRWQAPEPVSGVCANGVIMCDPGTWNNCRDFLWRADSAGKAALVPATPDRLGGCYCVNNGCGSNLIWNNSAILLKDLGGGIVGAIQAANPNLAISSVQSTPVTISYFGQDMSRPATGQNGAGGGQPAPPPQTAYFRNPPDLTSAATATATAQAADSSSLYSQVVGTFGTNMQRRTCSLQRHVTLTAVTFNDVLLPLGGSLSSFGLCGPECGTLVLDTTYKLGQPCKTYISRFSFFVKRPELIRSAILRNVAFDDHLLIRINGTEVYKHGYVFENHDVPFACERSREWRFTLNQDLTPYFTTPGQVTIEMVTTIAGGGHGLANIDIRLESLPCDVTDTINDTCQALETDPSCSLYEEKVDGVQTFRQGNATGLTPLPAARQITQGTCTRTLTYDWWQKERVYMCDARSFDFSTAATRYGAVVDSVVSGGTTYQDMRLVGGQWQPDSGSLSMLDFGSHAECEMACKTRRVSSKDQALLSGPVSQAQTDPVSYDILYHTCQDGVCPVGPGEEILKDCQCLNEFAEAATVMQMLRQAQKDMICSDGVAK